MKKLIFLIFLAVFVTANVSAQSLTPSQVYQAKLDSLKNTTIVLEFITNCINDLIQKASNLDTQGSYDIPEGLPAKQNFWYPLFRDYGVQTFVDPFNNKLTLIIT